MVSDAFFADVLATLHVAIVIFMITGVWVVPLGGWRGWGWVRRPVWRFVHLGIMAYIVFNAIRGELCFLTLWENDLREAAGQRTAYGLVEERVSFVGRLMRDILFGETEESLLHAIYIGVGVVVLAGWVFVPPRWRRPPVEPA